MEPGIEQVSRQEASVIKKLIIFGLIVLGAFIFYKKFMADTLENFFRQKKGNVDFLQQKVPNYKLE